MRRCVGVCASVLLPADFSIPSHLQDVTGISQIAWRPQAGILKEEGIEIDESEPSTSGRDSSSDTAESSTSEGRREGGASTSSSTEGRVLIKEGGLTFLATPYGGQKTGFYADQRETRAFVAKMCAGKTVLDLCCFR